MKVLRTLIAPALLLLVAAPVSRAVGQATEKAATEAKKEKEDKNEDEKEKPRDRYLAVIGAVVHTVTGPSLEGVAVLAKNGKIAAIGTDLEIPEEAETIDASGYHLYPGLVAAGSTYSLLGGGDPESSADVYDLRVTLGLAGGLTTVVSANTAAKLTYGTVEGILLKRGLFESISYSTQNPSGRRSFRKALERVRQHLRDLEEYERKKRTDPKAAKPDDKWIRGDYQKALRLLRGEAVGQVSANTTQEILEVSKLARLYGFKLVILGASEGWTVASDMAQAGVSAIISPRRRSDPDKRTNRPGGTTIQNARILWEHGVKIAVMPVSSYISIGGMAGRDLQHLPLAAAYAVRGGLSDQAALRAITIDAARILGVDHRVGSIEIGKDADFAIADGELLHYMTHIRWTIVNGRIAYDKMKETLFSHIRPGGDLDAPPPDDHWPRGLGEEW